MFAIVMCLVLFYIVCINGRRYVCCREWYVSFFLYLHNSKKISRYFSTPNPNGLIAVSFVS